MSGRVELCVSPWRRGAEGAIPAYIGLSIVDVREKKIVRCDHIVLKVLLVSHKCDIRQAVIITIVAVACIDGVELGVGYEVGDIRTCKVRNHESSNVIMVEEGWHMCHAVVSVDCDLLVLQLIFYGRHVVL